MLNVNQLKIQPNAPLAKLSTFGIGKKAKFFCVCRNLTDMKLAFQFAKQQSIQPFVIGKGSNSLFPDHDLNYLVIQNKIDFFRLNERTIQVGSGFSFSLLGMRSVKEGLTGLEFAGGIPGSVGGAIFMNAGANGQETKDCLREVLFLDFEGKEHRYQKKALTFAYRTSSFQQKRGAIIEATFELEPSNTSRETQKKILDYRKKTQPLKEMSAGCVFRNPDHVSASKLIDELGLKGERVGGAKVSKQHANFIINEGNATAKDVWDLIALIQEKVYAETGIYLEHEVRMIR